MKQLTLIECPSNLGLSKMPYAIEPGVRKLPDWFKKLGFHAAIHLDKTLRIPAPEYTEGIDEETQVRNADHIIDYALQQAEIVEREMRADSFLLLLGGDCTLLIGTAMALKRKGRFALFYLDGHTDYMKPEQSYTHGAAGMDLGIVCGYGPPKLTDIGNLAPYIEEQHVFCVGNREYDVDYEKPVKESQVTYIPLYMLREKGMERVLSEFFRMISQHDLDGFFIHFDVDVLNDEIMPAVDSRQSDGLSYKELRELLLPLLQHDKATGMEITILDPDLDPEGTYTREFIKNMVPIIDSLNP